MNDCLILAEIGECFNGSIDAALKLVDVADSSGCDYAKFQIIDTGNLGEDDPEKEWFERVTLNDDQVKLLIDYCSDKKINFLATPENVKKAELLFKLGQKAVKIASTCLGDKDLIRFIAKKFDTVFVSTGMASIDEIVELREDLRSVPDLYIMHCISEYPTGPLLKQRGLKSMSIEDVRLNMMLILKDLVPDCKIGYSDHTADILPPIVAVSMGAQVIEKHITLDRKTPVENYKKGDEYLGTDHVLSVEPAELSEMVRQIRMVEKIKGEWKWERSEGEKTLSKFLRHRFRQ